MLPLLSGNSNWARLALLPQCPLVPAEWLQVAGFHAFDGWLMPHRGHAPYFLYGRIQPRLRLLSRVDCDQQCCSKHEDVNIPWSHAVVECRSVRRLTRWWGAVLYRGSHSDGVPLCTEAHAVVGCRLMRWWGAVPYGGSRSGGVLFRMEVPFLFRFLLGAYILFKNQG